MKIRTSQIVIIAAFMICMTQPAQAASMRCGGHIISDGGRAGPGTYEVLKRCGEPTFRQGNTWIYEKNKRRTAIVFNDSGTISSIQGG